MLYLIGFLVCFFSLAFFTLCILPGLSLALWKKIVLVLFFLICYLGYRAFVHWYARYVPADTIISTAKLTIMVIFPVGLVLKEHLQR